MRWLVGFALIAVLLLLAQGVLPAEAHSFYSSYCCSDKDCVPAELGDVSWTPAGYSVKSTNEVLPFGDSRIQYSPPGEPGFRVCRVPNWPKLRCLYVPEPEG